MSDIGDKIVPAPAIEIVTRQLFNRADFAISENALIPRDRIVRKIAGKITKCATARSDEIRWRFSLAIKFAAIFFLI